MNSNRRINSANIKKFRKELQTMLEDIKKIDKKVLNKAMMEGLRVVKVNTPVGNYPSEVHFTTKDGKEVRFNVPKLVGGHLRRNWFITVTDTGNGVEAELFNNVEYAPYVNYGHRVRNRAGATVGFVKGKFMLEKAMAAVDRRIGTEFRKEVERLNKDHDK